MRFASFIAPGFTTTMKFYSVYVCTSRCNVIFWLWTPVDCHVINWSSETLRIETGDDWVQVYENQPHGIRVPASHTWSKNKDWAEMMDWVRRIRCAGWYNKKIQLPVCSSIYFSVIPAYSLGHSFPVSNDSPFSHSSLHLVWCRELLVCYRPQSSRQN